MLEKVKRIMHGAWVPEHSKMAETGGWDTSKLSLLHLLLLLMLYWLLQLLLPRLLLLLGHHLHLLLPLLIKPQNPNMSI